MPKIWQAISMPKVWVYRTIKEENRLGKVIVSLKIYPSDAAVELNRLKEKIEKGLPDYASIYNFAEEPIAYGLNALIAHITIPEEKPGGLDEVEKCLQKIDEISQIQAIMVRRI